MTPSHHGPRLSLRGLWLWLLFHSIQAALPSGAQERSLLVPEPDLSAMEEGVRHRVEELEATALALVRRDAPPPELAQAFAQLGYHYLAYELMDAAETAFSNCRRLAPDEYRWPYYLGIVLQSTGQVEAAARTFEEVLELRPGDLPTLIRLGDVYLELDSPPQAEASYRRALDSAPQSAAAYYGLGRAAAARGDEAAAVEHMTRALELEPTATIIHYPLAQAYRKLGDMDRAREHLRQRGRQEVTFRDPLGSQVAWLATGTAFQVVQALASDLESFSEPDFLGFALSQLGDVEGAIEEIEEILRQRTEAAAGLEPASEEAAQDRVIRARTHYLLGGLWVNAGSDDAARGQFEAALKLDPDLLDTRIKLGNVLARQGSFEEAIGQYSEVLARAPDSGPALIKRAAALMSLERDREAVADLERLVELDGQNREGRLRLARARQRLGELGESARHYKAALDLNLSAREKAQAHYQLGLMELRSSPVRAAQHFQSAVELDPGLEDAYFQFATTMGRLKDYPAAVKIYRRLVDLNPEHLGARLGEATALILLARDGEARQRLEEGVVRLPQSLELAHALARHLATAKDPAARDGERAVALALKVTEALPTLQHAETLAMSLAQASRFEEAVELQESLVRQAEARGDERVLSGLRRNLDLYKSGQPCCGGSAKLP